MRVVNGRVDSRPLDEQDRHQPNNRPYVNVRALERGLQLLVELANLGRARPIELAEVTGVDRTTVYRLLETLRHAGFVAQFESDGSFGLTENIRRLGEGYQETDRLRAVVSPVLRELVSEISWPSDFATFDAGAMLIRETTHPFSPFSRHRSMIGKRKPVLGSSLGRAVLWAASPTQRQIMLDLMIASASPEAEAAKDARRLDAIFADIDKRGYAWAIDGAESGISGISLPVKNKDYVAGAVNIIFYTSALKPETAAKRYLGSLTAAVSKIENQLVQMRI